MRSLPSKLRCHVFDLGAVKGLGNLGTRGCFGLVRSVFGIGWPRKMNRHSFQERWMFDPCTFCGARTMGLPSTSNETLPSQSSIPEAPSR